jgi:hypothetical protein
MDKDDAYSVAQSMVESVIRSAQLPIGENFALNADAGKGAAEFLIALHSGLMSYYLKQ